ncbi:uncharacterized protein MYCFIDRAFT_176742 [Pseudocercospora fijiensis CIRAD86]|uniref:Uncharacterized protein n=1 Tax=Pseudocercospora fijiensis (strain CIRAD86) TaxID=383855 RepID=M3AWF0_PSEFD|nr:uncharacterized protein MYCFIDRAFT_176742 [Pseudocercospora fijiensis CIRAD86]EME81463.1 hypothetical protein MYCFIDRAFT_176742 [Pseudocercospora fijiensis CIRAD86]
MPGASINSIISTTDSRDMIHDMTNLLTRSRFTPDGKDSLPELRQMIRAGQAESPAGLLWVHDNNKIN